MNWNKISLFEISANYWKACTIHTGVKLDIFTFIGKAAKSAEEIAKGIEGSPRGVTALLNALVAMGLLTKAEKLFSNTDFSRQYLSKKSDDYKGFILIHHYYLMQSWSNLPESVLTGQPNRSRLSTTDEEDQRESFLMGMYNIASETAPIYSKIIDLSQKKRMLDLGGGPGTYSIHFCLNNPDLKATVFDLPTTRKFAEKTITSFDLSERIEFKEGNFLDKKADPGKNYDLVWISHILHGEGKKDAETVIAKAVKALISGGQIMIHDFILNDSMDEPLLPALFSLNMLVETEEGQTYSENQIKKMLEKQGIVDIKRFGINSPTGAGIITGIKA